MKVFLIFLIIRLASVYLVQTYFVPDEYYQSVEVAHKWVFNFGYLSWEWHQGIRSYIPPLLIAMYYKLLQVIGIDCVPFLVYGPRIFQASLSAYSDLCFYRWSGTKKWAMFCIASSWFWFYMGSRTLINSLECAFTTIALSRFPWPGKLQEGKTDFIWIVALLFVIRPTSAIVWIPLCFYHLILNKKVLWDLLIEQYLIIGLSVLGLSVFIDSYANGSLTITTYNFMKFNLLKDIGSFYGSHPWHWYLSTGFPAILGIQFLPFILASIVVLKNKESHLNELAMLGTLIFVLAVYSLIPHKEFRFIIAVLPIVLYLTSKFLAAWSRKASRFSIWLVASIIFFGNVFPAYYLSMVHQRGTLDVMEPLREIALKDQKNTSFLFLMPCHSTPLYSHLHVNVTTRFLTCLPNLSKIDDYVDEAESFYNNPSGWLRKNYPSTGTLPSHVIMFDILAPHLSDLLSRYNLTHTIFHTNIPMSSRIGSQVLIYERMNMEYKVGLENANQ